MNILAGHMLGDFLLQNRWLAREKMQAWWGMLLHCVIVTLAVCLFTGWWDYRALCVLTSHFIIDFFGIGKDVWPALIDQGDPDSSDPAPTWLRLVMDQAFHIISYAAIARWL